jgi:hypothetical protein
MALAPGGSAERGAAVGRLHATSADTLETALDQLRFKVRKQRTEAAFAAPAAWLKTPSPLFNSVPRR